MKHFFLLSVLMITHSFAAEIVRRGNDYVLRGACSEAAQEIKVINPLAKPECVCSYGVCETALSEHLPERIKYTLSNPQKTFGPNCWNSVLYTVGLDEGLHGSEIDFWLDSPLCKAVTGSPEVGSIIHVRERLLGTGPYMSNHSYRLISSSIAFNKDSPEVKDIYELISPMESLNRKSIPEECRFITQERATELNCRYFSEAYNCPELGKVMSYGPAATTNELMKLSRVSTGLVTAGSSDKLVAATKKAKELMELAMLKLGATAAFKAHKKGLQDALVAYWNDGSEEIEKPNDSDMRMVFTDHYIQASSDFRISNLGPADKKLIELLRSKSISSQLPLNERLYWSNVYLTSMSLHDQFNPEF